jgi:hypothetical protein
MSHFLVRLAPDQQLGELGPDWEDQVEVITPLAFLPDRYTAPAWLRSNPNCDPDWGTSIWEVRKDELRRLLGARPEFKHESMNDLRQAEKIMQRTIDELPDDGRYGVVWMEE